MSSLKLRHPVLGLGPVLLGVALLVAACSDDEAGTDPDGSGGQGIAGEGPGGSGGTGGNGGTDNLGGTDGLGGTGSGTAGAPVEAGSPGVGGHAGGGGGGGSDLVGGAGSGSGGEAVGGEGGAGTELRIATPEDLTDESSPDYGNNEHGLITGWTLTSWVDDWAAQRPSGVTGKLVVLQVVPSLATSKVHVEGNGTSVVSYLVPQGELTKLRDNGLSQIEAEIPDGTATDAWLKKYGIDVAKDFVALTFEQLPAEGDVAATTNAIVQQVGRAWLLLRYWGFPAERIALLNGSVNWNAATQTLPLEASTLAATPPNDGTTSVKDLWVDNTALVITLEELLATLQGKPNARPLAQVTLLDARGGAEALGLLKSTNTGKTDCPSYTGTGANARCSPFFEGRLKGAHSVPWAQFLDTSPNGFRFLSKSAVKALFDVQSGYQAGNLTIQYCRTNVRSMVTGIVAAVILGYPTRFYDTSFIEWSHLAYGPTDKTRSLSADSPFRTDLATLTEHATVTGYTPGLAYDALTMPVTGWVDGPNYNGDDDVSNTPPSIVPSATTTTKSVTDDRAYKLPQ